jgi:hypothetical protein
MSVINSLHNELKADQDKKSNNQDNVVFQVRDLAKIYKMGEVEVHAGR